MAASGWSQSFLLEPENGSVAPKVGTGGVWLPNGFAEGRAPNGGPSEVLSEEGLPNGFVLVVV